MSAEAVQMEDRLLRREETRLRLVRLVTGLLHEPGFVDSLRNEGIDEPGKPPDEVLAPYILP